MNLLLAAAIVIRNVIVTENIYLKIIGFMKVGESPTTDSGKVLLTVLVVVGLKTEMNHNVLLYTYPIVC